MYLDLAIRNGPSGGLTFEFMPSHHAIDDRYQYDRNGPDVFNISEQAFLFLQSAISAGFPPWKDGYHYYGVTRLPAETWYAILSALDRLRFDLRAGVHPKLILARAYMSSMYVKLNRRAVLNFLDRFERRVRTVLAQYPYLLIAGI